MNTHPLFGPVRSRRLGCSLGVDMILTKTCSYDCVYCECGSTLRLTSKRKSFFPVSVVIEELNRFLSTDPLLDFITFSGEGEPTLSLDIGTVIRFIRDNYPCYPIAVLTNGSLLSDPEVRKELLLSDVVLPTFSTVNETTFTRIHRPSRGIDVSSLLNGLISFRSEYSGEIWLEIFIIPDLNSSPEEILGIRDAIVKISPDRVQINYLDRPGTEGWIRPLKAEELKVVMTLLDDTRVEDVFSSFDCHYMITRQKSD